MDSDVGVVCLQFLVVTSGVLVLVVPETHMSVHLQLHSGLHLGLCRYEGMLVKSQCPRCCVCSENVCDVPPGF